MIVEETYHHDGPVEETGEVVVGEGKMGCPHGQWGAQALKGQPVAQSS